MRAATRAAVDLVQRYQAGKDARNQPLINAILRGSRQVHERLTELKWKIGDGVAYPFEHAQEGISLGRYALPSVPDAPAIRIGRPLGGSHRSRSASSSSCSAYNTRSAHRHQPGAPSAGWS